MMNAFCSVPWQVMALMSPSYIRRVRLVCSGWSAYAGRFCRGLKPEYLQGGGARLAQRFPFLRVLDLSHCSEIVIHATVSSRCSCRRRCSHCCPRFFPAAPTAAGVIARPLASIGRHSADRDLVECCGQHSRTVEILLPPLGSRIRKADVSFRF